MEPDIRGRRRSRRPDYPVEIEDFDLCPRFSVRVFTDVQVGPSPLWLKARLMAAGQRPISNVVDITNYVMLTLGQPMHAYDLDRVAGPRAARARGARGRAAHDARRRAARVRQRRRARLRRRAAPPASPASWAARPARCRTSTTRVAMEAATWNGTNILQTSKKLGLRSEASTRFEKQLHPRLALQAQRLAARLMVELCGARMVPGTIDVAAPEPEPHRITMRTRAPAGPAGRAHRAGGVAGDPRAPRLRRGAAERRPRGGRCRTGGTTTCTARPT